LQVYARASGCCRHIHRLSAALIGLLERVGNARLEHGDARSALELAEKAIALDQFHEASWRLALQADYALGLRESITRRYDDLARALDEQLGLQPTRETRVMYRQCSAKTKKSSQNEGLSDDLWIWLGLTEGDDHDGVGGVDRCWAR
jgi:DNA-binding SARP family transcriptional activator